MRSYERLPSQRGHGNALSFLFCLLLLTGLFSPLAAQAGSGRLIPMKDLPEDAPDIDSRSEQSLSVKKLTAPFYANKLRPGPDSGNDRAGEPQTLNVLVLRLGYRENRRPDLNTIAPDGGFYLSADDVPEHYLRVDPPPHDAAYFDAHMRALLEFYRIQSYGLLDIEWTIAEGPGEGGSFLMDDIADFGPGEAGEFWTLELLETFVRASLDTLDSQLHGMPGNTINFADYDNIIVFHAGSDFQNDIYRDSPNDLPSFNIFFGDPLGLHPVDGGDYLLGSVLLLPETTTQDVEPGGALGSLNSVLAHEYGHQMDFVDTYNVFWGWPSVGYWDLMDSGHQILYGFLEADYPDDPLYVYGALPASYGMWHRMLAGWVNEEDGSLLRPGGGVHEGLTLTASNLQVPGVKCVRVDLSDREYFLLESRQELLHPGGRYVKRDADTGVFMFVSKDFPQYPDSAFNSGEYDLFLPQSGLLAWHIDERDFEYLYPLNEINPDHDRHVQLIQADGVNDLGDPYSWTWRGDEYDPFYTGHVTEWNHDTVPSTRLRDGSASGFSLGHLETEPYLDDENAFDPLITFDIAISGVPAGFPRDDSERVDDTLAILPAGGTLLPMGDWLCYMLASLYEDGVPPDTMTQAHWLRSGRMIEPGFGLEPLEPLPRVDGLPLGALHLPAAWDPDNRYWAMATGQELHFLRFAIEADTDFVHYEFPVESGISNPFILEDGLVAGPVAGANEEHAWLSWVTEDGVQSLLRLSLDREGTAAECVALPSERGDRAGEATIRLLTMEHLGLLMPVYAFADDDDSYAYALDPITLTPALEFIMPTPEGRAWWLRVLDVDEDDQDDLVYFDDSGRVFRLVADAQPELLFDADLGDGAITRPPIPADLNGDGRPELFLPEGSHVHRYSLGGFEHQGWPIRLEELLFLDEPMQVGSGLRAADMDGDNISELILFAQTGHLLIVGDAGRPLLGTPRSLAAQAPVDVYARAGDVYAVSRDGFLLCFEGSSGAEAVADWPLAAGGPERDGRWTRLHTLSQVADFPAEEGWLIYPNPAGARASLYHGAVVAGSRVEVAVYDLEGQLAFRKRAVAEFDGPWELELDLAGLAPAVYFCRCEVVSQGRSISFVRRLAVLR